MWAKQTLLFLFWVQYPLTNNSGLNSTLIMSLVKSKTFLPNIVVQPKYWSFEMVLCVNPAIEFGILCSDYNERQCFFVKCINYCAPRASSKIKPLFRSYFNVTNTFNMRKSSIRKQFLQRFCHFNFLSQQTFWLSYPRDWLE